MCLRTVTKRSPRQRAVRTAYKAVALLKQSVCGAHRRSRIKPSRWYSANRPSRRVMLGYESNRYEAGFHVFARAKDARQHGVAIPVKVRRIHTVGRQWDAEVWVAEEMFVSVVEVRRALAAASK